MARFLLSLNKVDLASFIGSCSWAEGVLHSLVSVEPEKNIGFWCCRKIFSVGVFSSLGGKIVLAVEGGELVLVLLLKVIS